MAGTGTKYTVNVHTDSADVIVFDGITVDSFSDSTAATAATTTIKVGSNVGPASDSFAVITDYPAAYAGAAPGTLRVNEHIIAAFNAIVAAVNAGSFVPAGPRPEILTLGSLVGGTGYPDLTDFVVQLTGGTGKGARAKITASGGAVTSCTLLTGGEDYTASDVLSAYIGVTGHAYPATNGSGFTVTAATVGTTITNPNYL
jgi:hypothetical protein